ncbi:aldo/keto reductase [Marinobacterium rhizophilum]|uniref:Aldo/keto reductase n=1 Tax=Marinobacterium rhizophilum TaxID=420402 RepID=A0ABY5HLJ5_9GAMM|nr:aldo/keto reductase [Marinobacterium rhizophilum]UTW12999.1 aldo/keto reductase [Marinobacterium rhizophilum]
MKTRLLGKSGLEVSEIGLGCWQLGGDFGPVADAQATQILDSAWNQSVHLWDTADVYGAGQSEQRIGDWCARTGNPVTVITKLGRDGSLYPSSYSKTGVRASLQGSARRLGVERLTLAQLHCVPFDVLRDGEIFTWLDELRSEGLIQHYGASVETLEEGLYCLRQPNLASLQIIFNLFRQDAITELLPAAAQADVGVIVRLPLASGLLSGKFAPDHRFSEQDHRHFNRDGQAFNVGETFSGLPFGVAVDRVQQLAALLPKNMTLAQLALRWILDQPAVSTVIAGVSKAEQLAANVAASALEPLPRELHQQLFDFYAAQVRGEVRGAI